MQPLDCIKGSHRNAYLIFVNLASMLKCVTLAQFTRYDSAIYWSYHKCLSRATVFVIKSPLLQTKANYIRCYIMCILSLAGKTTRFILDYYRRRMYTTVVRKREVFSVLKTLVIQRCSNTFTEHEYIVGNVTVSIAAEHIDGVKAV